MNMKTRETRADMFPDNDNGEMFKPFQSDQELPKRKGKVYPCEYVSVVMSTTGKYSTVDIQRQCVSCMYFLVHYFKLPNILYRNQ